MILRTVSFSLFRGSDRSFCHSSSRWFSILNNTGPPGTTFSLQVHLIVKQWKSSVLREASKCYKMKEFKWETILTELLEKAPDIGDILFAPNLLSVRNVLTAPSRQYDMAWSILMNLHNTELSIVQKVITCILGVSGCNKAVSTLSNFHYSHHLVLSYSEYPC